MMKCPAVALLCCAASPLAFAEGFQTFNAGSFARTAVLPALLATPVLDETGYESRVTLDWSNESYGKSNAREALLLDAETLRLTFSYRRALGGGWQAAAELPLIFSGGGVLDPLIEGWHSAFGLPNSNRKSRPQNDYRIRYDRDGVTRVDLDQGDNGLGDVRLGLSHVFSPRLALHSVLQLPTGNKNALAGGHFGGALWAAYRQPLGGSGRASLELAAGASAAQASGPLADLQRPLLAMASAALTVPLSGRLDGVVQLSAHSAPYRGSSLSPLGKFAAPLTVGLRYPLQRAVVELAIEEDPSVNASPDFGLHLSVRLTP